MSSDPMTANKFFRKLGNALGQPYRYLTVTGEVYDRPFMDRFIHRAELKATAACVLAISYGINKFLGIPFPEVPAFLLGSVGGYVTSRRGPAQIHEMLTYMLFQRQAVIDTKPDKNIKTSPDDLLRAQAEKDSSIDTLKNYGISMMFRTAVTTGMVAIVNERIQDPFLLAPVLLLQGFSMGLDLGVLFRNTSNVVRMDRVLNGEYVVLSEPPEKQEARSKIQISLPETSAPVPHPAGMVS